MLHYPNLIDKFVPISHLWSMRYEAKHRISKIAARSSFNMRNICLSLALKHQLQLNEILLNSKLCKSIIVGPRKILNSIKMLKVQTELNFDSEIPLICVKSAKVKGTHYKFKTILTKNIFENEYPIFASIKNVFLFRSDAIILEVSLLIRICFNEHLFSYEVKIPDNDNATSIVFQESFIPPIPNNINIISNGKRYITIRSPL